MEAKFHTILHNPRRLKAMTGFDLDQFNQLLPHFEKALYDFMAVQTMEGFGRQGRRFSQYKNSPLPTVADKQLFILTYLRTNPVQEVQGQMFEMGQPSVSRWFHLLHEVLNLALDQQDFLPIRNGEELETWLEQLDATIGPIMPASDMPDPSSSESDASSPTSPLFFIKTVVNGLSADR